MKPDRTPMSRRPRPPPKPKTIDRNTEQDPVEVFCRIRPQDSSDEEMCVCVMDSRTVKLKPPISSFAFRNGNAKEQEYRFQRVFGPNTSQKDLFDTVAKPLVSDVLRGKNGLLFAYGVTGSGKTYTMQGTPRDGGIALRCLDVIFNSISENQAKRCIFKPDGLNGFEGQSEADAMGDRRRLDATPAARSARTPRFRREPNGSHNSSDRVPDSSRVSTVDDDSVFSVFVSYIEIYNNYLYDLLEENESMPSRGPQVKILREDANHNMYVHACNEVEVKSADDALEIMQKGQRHRRIAYTKLNCESSRSHSIFSIRIVQAPLDVQGEDILTGKNCITVSQLSLVDLAGSERNNRTRASGERVKEAGNINNSLMTLRTCIEILRENQLSGSNRMVPYRDCKLTHLFKNYFDGEGRVKMVVCVNPKADDYDETLPVMKFAELASEVQVQRANYSAKHELGLPSGRRRANLLFREAQKRAEEETALNVKNLPVDLTPVYNLAPAWPPVSWTPETREDVIAKLKPYLIKLAQNRVKMVADIKQKRTNLGKLILKMEEDNILMRQENAGLKKLYDDAMSRVRNLETMVLNAESANESLQRKFTNYDNLVDECNAVREELEVAKTHGHFEKQRMKARLKTKLEAEKERLKKDMIMQLREQKSKTFKKGVRVLQEVLLESNTPNVSSAFFANPGGPVTRARVRSSRSDPKLQGNPDLHVSTARPLHRRSKSYGSEEFGHFQGENALKDDILAQIELLSASSRKRSSAESTGRNGSSSQENVSAGSKRQRI